jgi:hypothetical protein
MASLPPHDALFKAAFSQPDLARGQLQLVLPAALRDQLDFTTLQVADGSNVDRDLRRAQSDLLYGIHTRSGRPVLLYVLLEHQSRFDARMPLRLLRYVVRVWDRWVLDHPREPKLPIVIPVVLHHGKRRWRARPELASMLDADPALLDAAAPYLPLFRFVLDDLSPLSASDVVARPLHALALLVELAFWAARSVPRIRDAAPYLGPLEAFARDEPSRAMFAMALRYLLRTARAGVEAEQVRTILMNAVGSESREDILNYGDQLIEQGRKQGLEQGRVQGLRDAVMATFSARALPLSDAARERIVACADVARLELWLKRAVTASSEGQVFATEPR